MATYVKNFKEIQKHLDKRITYALKQTQQTVYKVIQDFIRQYYDEKVFFDGTTMTNHPIVYERTFTFFNSLVKSEIKKSGDLYYCEVYIDQEQLDYYAHDGLEVLNMINDGFHSSVAMNNGVYETPRDITSQIHFWDDSIEECKKANYIINELVRYLKRAGLNII